MYVAICDDNVADRKHLERLLSREADKRVNTSNVMYVDCYGNKEQFLKNPLKYNLVFMDMCSSPEIVEEILEKFKRINFDAPLILYSSVIDYTTIPELPDYVIHAKKPYTPDELGAYLKLGDSNATTSGKKIILHEDGEERYVYTRNISYFTDLNGQSFLFYADGTSFCPDESIADFIDLVAGYKEFSYVNKTTVANFRFVTEVTPLNITISRKRKFKILPLSYNELKELQKRYYN